MANTKTITKKDLEAQVKDLESDVEILRSSETALTRQTIDYWSALCDSQVQGSNQARILAIKDDQISELQNALTKTQDELIYAHSMSDGLEQILNAQIAQQDFVLRIVHAISIYGGKNLQVVRGLAESILEDVVEEQKPQ